MENNICRDIAQYVFFPMLADPDVYLRQARKSNVGDYHELLIVYVDDVLCCLHNPQLIIGALDLMYDLKDESAGPPTI